MKLRVQLNRHWNFKNSAIQLRKDIRNICVSESKLGVTNKINSKEQQLVMNKLYNLYTFSIDVTKDIQTMETKDIHFKIFSGNIIIRYFLNDFHFCGEMLTNNFQIM